MLRQLCLPLQNVPNPRKISADTRSMIREGFMSTICGLACCVLLLSLPTVGQEPSARTSDEKAIRAADAAWLDAVKAKDLDRIVSFYADDASIFPIAEPIATGKEAIRENWAHMLGIPGLQLVWQITKVAVSRSGDLAYVQSTYEASFENPEGGKPAVERGKAITVWKNYSGKWKAVVDISNTDAPPPAHKKSQAEQ